MRAGKSSWGHRAGFGSVVAFAAALALGLAAARSAQAHVFMVEPPPRDVGVQGNDAHKTGPCGGVARKGTPTKFAPGATVTLMWQETVSHRGCFQIGFSAADDQNFVLLKQIDDPSGGAGTLNTETVTLPAGVTCPACTLVVRQLMQGGPCAPNADPATSAQGTYYTCADICVGDTCGTDAGGPVTDAGSTTTDRGGSLADAGDADGGSTTASSGCAVSMGTPTGVSLAVTVGLAAVALLRRRRHRP